nr:hypothetical protein [Fimbriiglobus sp.]
RQRISEMREPPLGLDDVPHPALEVFFDEIQNAPSTQLLVGGVMLAVGNLLSAIHQYRQLTHPLTDAPSRRLLKFAMSELQEITSFYARVIDALECGTAEIEDWGKHVLEVLLAHADWFDDQEVGPAVPDANHRPAQPDLPRRYSATPYTYDPIPQRDERFTDLWNQGVNAEAFLYDETKPAQAKVLMMLYKRLREIDVPEMMASIIVQTKGKPWGYYRDMSRQLWDEARHAMMGEVGFVALGVDWTKARITWNWSYRLNTECTPMERHGVLFFIEQGLMPKTGKRYEFEVAGASGIPIAKTIQDFDWADEVLHSQIGREWYVKQFNSLQEALAFGDAAWTKITSNWTTVKEQGLTQHTNWWPAIYGQACAAAGREPDPTVMSYDETYEGKRADLKGVVGE